MDIQQTEQFLWDKYWKISTDQNRDELIAYYQNFLRISVKYMYKTYSGFEYDDYFQNGQLGLLQAIEGFDSSFDTSFKTYAMYRIRGSILSALHSMSERSAYYEYLRNQRKARLDSVIDNIDNRRQSVVQRIGDGVIQIAYTELLDNAYANESASFLSGDTVSLSPSVNFDTPKPWSDPYQVCSILRLVEQIKSKVERLSESEQTVVKMHYFSGLTFLEIAKFLGVSKGRVSQIHKKALIGLQRECDALASGSEVI